MPFLKTASATLFYNYLTNGRQDCLVLINSLGTSQQLWDEMVPFLIPEFNVLLFDKRGHGLSSVGNAGFGRLSCDATADDRAMA